MAKPPITTGQLQPIGLATQAQVQPIGLAGRFAFDPELAKQYSDVFGKDMGPLIYYAETTRAREADQGQVLKQQLDILGPYFKDVAKENQRLGMEANVFKSLLEAPKEFQRAMAEKYRFFGDQLGILAQNTQPASYPTRQYITL